MARSTNEHVWARAGDRCEYCCLPQFASSRRFQIDHIRAKQHGGESDLDNLALACVRCNKHKGPNLSGFDAVTSTIAPLFHPRQDRWLDHFHFDGAIIEGVTATGRATVATLDINHPGNVGRRIQLIAEGHQFQPTTG